MKIRYHCQEPFTGLQDIIQPRAILQDYWIPYINENTTSNQESFYRIIGCLM